MWNKITEGVIEESILYKPENNRELFDKFMKERNIVKYREIPTGVPFMWFLESGNERKHYSNTKNSVEFFKKYGRENVYEKLLIEVFDHCLAFKDADGKVFVVSHPYYGVGILLLRKTEFL